MKTEHADPLDDDYQPPASHECDHGWKQVKPPYAEHIALTKGEPDSEAYRLAYASLIQSYYPCSICRPNQFFRWVKGHYSKDHDTGTCPDCVALRKGRAAGDEARRLQAPDLPERKDLD